MGGKKGVLRTVRGLARYRLEAAIRELRLARNIMNLLHRQAPGSVLGLVSLFALDRGAW